MQFRGVTRCDPKDGNYVFLSENQMRRLKDAQRGSGLDGTVGPVTYSVDGETVDPISV